MGSSKSKSSIRTENNTTVINKSDINLLNKSVNKAISNVVSNTKQNCSNQVSLKNVIDFSGSTIKGNLNIGSGSDSNDKNGCKVNLEQEGAFTFKCTNASEMQNAVGSKMIDTIMQKLRNSNSSDIVQKLNAQAKTKAKKAGLDFGSSKADSKVDAINNYKQVNETEKDIQNVIKNVVTSNVTNNTVSNCINQINNKQGFNASGALIEGKVDFCNFQSKQVAKTFVNCMNKNNITNKVTNQTARSLGVDIKDDNKVKQKATSKVKTSTSAETTGIFGGLSASLASLGLGPLASPLISGCCFICCCIIIVIIILVVVIAFSAAGGDPQQAVQGASNLASNFGQMRQMQGNFPQQNQGSQSSLLSNIGNIAPYVEKAAEFGAV